MRPCVKSHSDPSRYAETCCRLCQREMLPFIAPVDLPPPCDSRVQSPAGKPPAPCIHDDGPANKIALGLHDDKTYRICAKGVGERKIPNDPKQRTAICPCEGCGPGCSSYEADTAEVAIPADRPLRHLLFHIMPVAHMGTWQRGLDQLLMRWPLFAGRKVIAIVTQSPATTLTLDPPERVREYLAGRGCEFLEIPNNPERREVETWGPLWSRLEEFRDSNDAVFYAHAKAVTRPYNPGVSCHPWTRIMFSALLDYYLLVEESLRKWPITGAFKKVGMGFGGSRSSWHYSGSFFWIRAREAFKHGRVREIDQVWWGNESWPGLHFPPEHAGCIFHEGFVPQLDLYNPSYMRGVVEEFQQWVSQNRQHRSIIG
jgi:hypothetical protein